MTRVPFEPGSQARAGRTDLYDQDKYYVSLQPYQTGPLGLLPDTELTGSLLTPKSVLRSRGQVELYLTAEPAHAGRLCTIRCILYDGPGVVDRLLAAIAELSVNIAYMRSGPIRNGHLHVVEILADWNQSPYRGATRSRGAVERSYPEMRHRIPIGQHRYALLYEAIVTALPTEIFLDDAYELDEKLPSLVITPLAHRHAGTGEPRRITRSSEIPNLTMKGPRQFKPSYVELTSEESRIAKEACEYKPEELPLFFVTAESDTRTLRVTIPHKRRAERIVCARIIHADNPGALHTVMNTIEATGFNVLSSVTRRRDSSTAEVEVTIEPKIKAHDPVFQSKERASRGSSRTSFDTDWLDVADEQLSAAVRSLRTLDLFTTDENQTEGAHVSTWNPGDVDRVTWLSAQIRGYLDRDDIDDSRREAERKRLAGDWMRHSCRVVAPRYPRAENQPEAGRERAQSTHPDGYVPRPRDIERALREQVAEKLEESYASLAQFPRTTRVHNKSGWLTRLRILSNEKPKIFLSYPKKADKVVEAITTQINNRKPGYFEFVEYQDQDFKSIPDEVPRRINSADFFIGIWHHEPIDVTSRTGDSDSPSVSVDADDLEAGDEANTDATEQGSQAYAVSPWLPYELGLARSANIPSIVIHSKKLSPSVIARISPSIAEPSYRPDQPYWAARNVADFVQSHWMDDDYPESDHPVDVDEQPSDPAAEAIVDLVESELEAVLELHENAILDRIADLSTHDLAMLLSREVTGRQRSRVIAAIAAELLGRKSDSETASRSPTDPESE